MTDERGVPQTFIGFAIGLGIGAALAILFAPRSGEETRQYLLDGATDMMDDAVARGRKLTKRAQRVVNDVAERVMDATEAGERSYRKAKTAAQG
jgi:gas vesicle protein